MHATEWVRRADQLGAEIGGFSAVHDEDSSFVNEGFAALTRGGYLAALIPHDLGGMGATLREGCEFIRALAHHCPSTALAYAMHSHLVATTVWKHTQGKPGEALLRKVVQDRCVLVSTGAGDWLESNGALMKVEGGYRFSARKTFASGSPAGHLMLTSGRFEDPERGPMVLHFALPLSAEGVTIARDWDAHGMRGTGSHTVVIEGAFVPDASIALVRLRGPWDPMFDVICTVALPIIMSVYVGIAERACELAIESARARAQDPDTAYVAGQLVNELFQVRALWNAQVDNACEYDFLPDAERSSRSVQAKTMLSAACIRTVEKAMELGGGGAYFRASRLESLMRDVRAAPYHPMQAVQQQRFSGRIALGQGR